MEKTKKNEDKIEDKIEKFYYRSIEFSKEIITDLKNKKEFYLSAAGKKIKAEINYIEDRNKWHLLITEDGLRKSLSFFDRIKLAEINLLNNLLIKIGIIVNNNVGD